MPLHPLHTFILLCSTPIAAVAEKVTVTDLAAFKDKVAPFIDTYCIDCHEDGNAKADFRLDDIDPLITGGKDVERWEKALEMISIGDMPPRKKKQPEKHSRRQIEEWILGELRKIGRGPDESRLTRPEFGNRVDHDELFSGEHSGPAFSPPRIWRINEYIYKRFVRDRRLGRGGGNPFAPLGGHSFKDYDHLYAGESTILGLRNNADAIAADLIDGRFIHPKGPDGKPDKSRRVREGKAKWGEYRDLIQGKTKPTEQVLEQAVERAFLGILGRRPTEEETIRYSDRFLKKAIEIAGPKEALKSLIAAIMLAPEFIYRQEMGLGEVLPDGRRRLSPSEISFALAFALTDSPPDNELRKAVEENRLSTKEGIAREIRRILDADYSRFWATELTSVESYIDNSPNPRVLRFFREYFGYKRVFEIFKDKERNHHHRELFIFKDADLFVLSVLREDKKVLENLLTSNRYVVHYASPGQVKRKMDSFRERKPERETKMLEKGITPALGGYRGGHYFTTYGFEYETWNYPIEQPFPIENRAGMLTHPAWLVAHSGNFDTDPIRRGKWIQEHLLGGIVPDIPIGVDAKLEEDPTKTLRQKLHKTTEAQCWRCHKKMNPLGLPFESFDDFGRFRKDFYFDQNGHLGGTFYEREKAIQMGNRRGGTPVEYTTQPINSAGELIGTGDPKLDGKVKDAFDLVQRLAKSDRVRQTFVRHAFRYWMGRNETLNDSPTLMAADKAYTESNGSFTELLISLLTSDSFLTRKGPSQ
ncbi:MAG: DUF1588 domain-containing protein [Akkermansiaceae bacterium]